MTTPADISATPAEDDIRPSIADPGVLSFLLADLSMAFLQDLKTHQQAADAGSEDYDFDGHCSGFVQGLASILLGQTDLFEMPSNLTAERLAGNFRTELAPYVEAADPEVRQLCRSDEGIVMFALSLFLDAFIKAVKPHENEEIEAVFKALAEEDFFEDWADWILGKLPCVPIRLAGMVDDLVAETFKDAEEAQHG